MYELIDLLLAGAVPITILILILWVRAGMRRPVTCGEHDPAGWTCNRLAGHRPDFHEYYNPGTGHGDDKVVRWGVAS